MTYAQFRGSAAFPALLASVVASWIGWSVTIAHGWLPRNGIADIPGEWGTLNVALSIEASVATSLLLMDMARSEAVARQHLARVEEQAGLIAKQMVVTQHMIEAQLALIERIGDVGPGADPDAGVGLGEGGVA